MKTTELQINDWVMYRGKPRRITGLDESSVYFEKYCTECHKAESVSAIPLTPEFFERNGFEKCLGVCAYGLRTERGTHVVVWLNVVGGKNASLTSIDVNDVPYRFPEMFFVHQFQNVFRLLRIKKDIEV